MNIFKRFWRWLFGKKPGQVAGGVAVSPVVQINEPEIIKEALLEMVEPKKQVRWPPPRSMTSAE